jgi:hypothetical protein
MKRLFWLGVGMAAGAYLTRRVSQAAQQLTPAGLGANLADGLRELGAGLGAFGAEVRAGMTAREQELAALLERRTGATVPTLVEALQDPAPRSPSPARTTHNGVRQNGPAQNGPAQNGPAQNGPAHPALRATAGRARRAGA